MPKTYWECDGCKRHWVSGDTRHEVIKKSSMLGPAQEWWLCGLCWAAVERCIRALNVPIAVEKG